MDLTLYPLATREQWLARVALGMRAKFKEVGAPLPKKLRVTMSLTKRNKAVGTCFDPRASADGTTEIIIRLDQYEPVEVAAILCHELIHAAVGCEAGHGAAFKRVALALGLEGKMTATTPGEEFKQWSAGILSTVGKFPHAALNFDGIRSGPKKQTTRLLKVECEECGYVARVARSWLEEMGAPLCPCSSTPMSADVPEEEG